MPRSGVRVRSCRCPAFALARFPGLGLRSPASRASLPYSGTGIPLEGGPRGLVRRGARVRSRIFCTHGVEPTMPSGVGTCSSIGPEELGVLGHTDGVIGNHECEHGRPRRTAPTMLGPLARAIQPIPSPVPGSGRSGAASMIGTVLEHSRSTAWRFIP
jgi:hypothetical protein